MRYPFLQRHANGKLWPAGHHIFGLCAAWNHATNPALLLSDREHDQSRLYALVIKLRMERLGLSRGRDWKELSNGTIWPLSHNRKAA